ncbi:smoothelin-like protein 1 [Oncorhynchus mykiss]|uniref:smoothelin-like protein 1 n=1 Tax=Oncorhynchus mykiss TaxID=8022 RepID=UPI001878B0B2|nr:smoothelin-like protein 1 [Oncorhynchus mykiss]
MDDVSLHQEDSGNDATANQIEDNNNNQTEREAPVQECDPPKREHLAEDTVEGHRVKSGANRVKTPEQATGASIENIEESQTVTDANEVNGEEACKGEEGPCHGADTGETEDPKLVKGEGESEMEEHKNGKGQEVVKNGEIEKKKEELKEDKEKGGENNAKKEGKGGKIEKRKGDEEKRKDRKIKAGKGEGEAGKGEAGKGEAGKGEAGKGVAGKGEAGKGVAGKGDGEAVKGEEGKGEGGEAPENKSKPVKEKEGAGGGKVKEKSKEVEKQGKTKRKSVLNPTASTPSSAAPSVIRPRNSARSARMSRKNDIIAKFQQNAPETPVVRNFKLQRSSMAVASGASIKQKVLSWCANKTRNYEGVSIENFSSSWCDGLAFCALIHRFFPDAFDFSALKASEKEKNFTLAFNTAETMADCYPLLEVGDMLLMGNRPDPMCVFTYVQALCHHLSKIEKEKKDKEEMEKKDTAEEKKSEKMTDGEVETTTEKKEEESVGGENKGKDGKEKESEESSAVEGEKEREEREVVVLVEGQA